jgi:hypothetical protein
MNDKRGPALPPQSNNRAEGTIDNLSRRNFV